jgi:N-acetylneuraminic acid mutarotase
MIRNLQSYKAILFGLLLFFTQHGLSQEWTWINGSSVINTYGNYGSQGVAASSNVPGARHGGMTWTDASGNLWLFGGEGFSSSAYGFLNDMWKWNPSTSQWVWMSGLNAVNQWGNYGTMGTAGSSNLPGSRGYAVTWTDNSGYLWMFGGYGYDASGNIQDINDLWKYNTSTNQWTWVNGSNSIYQNGIYGTQGVGSSTNTPGARRNVLSWKDNSGYLWLYGGYGLPASGGAEGYLNDAWKYDVLLNTWTWFNGTNLADQAPSYGTQGTASATNNPGGRNASAAWKDNSGNLWLFGGYGYASNGAGYLNDVWKLNTSTSQWTWMKGSNSVNQSSVFGTQTVFSSSNTPGARNTVNAWSDASGNLYIFGGYGVSTNTTSAWNLNDMWKYDVSTNNWAWIRGVSYEVVGNYGTIGVLATSNDPGSRYIAMNWKDNSGNIWLFGGQGYDMYGNYSILNDIWKMNPCPAPAPVYVGTWGSQNICTGSAATLTAVSNSNTVTWYSSPSSTTALGTGSTYITPSLSSGTITTGSFTYYAAASNTCGTSLVRTPVVVTSNSIYPVVTTGPVQFTASHYIGNGATNVSDWSPWNYYFTDPVPTGGIITGVDLTCDGVDQGWGGSGFPADMRLNGTRVGLTVFLHYWQNFNVGNTDPFSGYVYGGTNLFQMYFAGWGGWQGFINNASLTFRYQNKTPAAITACQNSTLNLVAYGATTYTWSGGITNNVPFTVSSTQIYTVTGANVYGCTNTATQQVNAVTAPTVAVSGNTAVCLGNSVVYTASGANTYSWSSGSATNTETLTPAGTSTFGVIGTSTASGCTSSQVTRTIVVNTPPVISVNSGSICSGQPFTLVASGASTYTYSGGSNVVSPLTSTNYFVTGTSSFGCVSASSATANITVSPTPTVTVNSGVLCAGTPFTLTPSGALGYTITGGSSVIAPTVSTNYSVTGISSAGCIGNTAVSTMTVNPLPLLSITGPTAVCNGSSITQSVTGANTYSWSTGSTATNIIISPTVSGTYLVSGTISATGCSNSASRLITVGYVPVITVNSGAICAGKVFTMVPSGASTYTFSNGSNTVAPTVNTTYFVSGTSSLGCVSTSSAVSNVIVNASPVINVNSGTICAGNIFTMVPSGANTYTFSSVTATVAPSSNNSYSVTGTNILGCVSASPAVANVTVNPLPIVTVTNGSVCAGSVFTIIPGGVSTFSVSTSSGTVTSMVSPTANTTYSVIGTSSAGCPSSNTGVLTVSAISLPTISVNSGTVCDGKTFTMVPSGASTYTFSNGSSTVIPFVNSTYSVTGTSSAGCVSANAAIANVTIISNPVVSVNSGAICAGKVFTIVPSGASSYTVSGLSYTVSPLVTTSYSLAGTNSLGCVSSNTAFANVIVNQLPSIAIIGNSVVCSGQSSNLTAVGANTFTWSNNLTGQTIGVTPVVNTIYTVTGTDGNNCINTGTLQMLVNPQPTVSLNSGTVCPLSNFTLIPTGALTYTYSSGSNVVSPSVTTSYSVTGIDINGCISAMPAVTTVTVVNNISISVSGNTMICIGGAATLSAVGANDYEWSTNENTSSVITAPTINTTYSVIGASGTCKDTVYVTVSVNALPSLSVTSSSSLICSGESVTITADGANSFSWNIGDTTSIIVVNLLSTTAYTVAGTDGNGCTAKTVITQNVDECLGIKSNKTGSDLHINVYPNPSNGNFIIETPAKINVRITNSIGQVIVEEELFEGRNKIDLNKQAMGIYFLELKQGKQTKTIKLIKD